MFVRAGGKILERLPRWFGSAVAVLLVCALPGCTESQQVREDHLLKEVRQSLDASISGVNSNKLRRLDVQLDQDPDGTRLKQMREAPRATYRFAGELPDYSGWRIVGAYESQDGSIMVFRGNLFPGYSD